MRKSPDLLEQAVSVCGFTKRKGVWQRELPHLIQVAKVTRSRFGGRCYLELGILLKDAQADPKISLTPMDWHVSARADELFDDRRKALNGMDDDVHFAAGDREEIVKEIVDNACRRFFDQYSTTESIIDLARRELNPIVLANNIIRDYAAIQIV